MGPHRQVNGKNHCCALLRPLLEPRRRRTEPAERDGEDLRRFTHSAFTATPAGRCAPPVHQMGQRLQARLCRDKADSTMWGSQEPPTGFLSGSRDSSCG